MTQEKKDKALQWVKDCNKEFDNLSDRIKDKLLDFYRLYRTFENEEKPPGQSNIFIPKVYEIIENKVPVVIANDPRIVVSPKTNDAAAYVGGVRDMIDYWWAVNKMKLKLEAGVKDAFIYGHSPWRVDWKQEVETVEIEEAEEDEVTGETMLNKKYEEQVVREYPTAKALSPFDIKVDPRVETFQDGVGVIQRIKDVRYSDLKKMGDMYDLSELDGVEPDKLTDNSYDKYEKEVEDGKGVNALSSEIDKNRIVLLEFWGRFSEKDDGSDEVEYIITTIAVDNEPKYVIRCQPNKLGFRPFAKIDDRVVRGEFYSIGEVEPLEGPQIEYNNIRNARIDFNNAINYPEWMYNVNAGINPANLVHRPNNLIPIDLPIGTDITSVLRPVDKPQPPVSGINEEAQFNRDFQSISQTIDFTDRGGSRGFTNTATGVKSRDNQVSQRANNIVSHLESFIGEIGEMWLALAEQFAEDEIEIKRPRTELDMEEGAPTLSEAPNKFTLVDKSVLKRARSRYEVIVEGGSTTANSAAGKAQDATNIANTAVQFKGMGVNIDMEKVFKDILTHSYQKANPEEYILPPQAAPVAPEEPPGKLPMQPSQPAEINQYT